MKYPVDFENRNLKDAILESFFDLVCERFENTISLLFTHENPNITLFIDSAPENFSILDFEERFRNKYPTWWCVLKFSKNPKNCVMIRGVWDSKNCRFKNRETI